MIKRVGILIKSNLFFLCVLTLVFFAAWQTSQINELAQDVQTLKSEVEIEIAHMSSLADKVQSLYQL